MLSERIKFYAKVTSCLLICFFLGVRGEERDTREAKHKECIEMVRDLPSPREMDATVSCPPSVAAYRDSQEITRVLVSGPVTCSSLNVKSNRRTLVQNEVFGLIVPSVPLIAQFQNVK